MSQPSVGGCQSGRHFLNVSLTIKAAVDLTMVVMSNWGKSWQTLQFSSISFSVKLICGKARDVARQTGIPSQNFNAPRGWPRRNAPNRMTLAEPRTTSSEKLTARTKTQFPRTRPPKMTKSERLFLKRGQVLETMSFKGRSLFFAPVGLALHL